MNALSAIEAIEFGTENYDEMVEAWQYLIDTGIVWTLQGSYGRTAAQLIGDGTCSQQGDRQ